MAWSLQILGTNAAIPVLDRYPSAHVLHLGSEIVLIDCGEGTQSRLSQFGIKRSKINRIFISHLHGDHIFGLPGLITSYNLFQRKSPLFIYGPVGIQSFIKGILNATGIVLNFELQVKEHSMTTAIICETADMIVQTIPLLHRIPCTGYLFREKVPSRRIDKVAATRFQVPFDQMQNLQQGNDWVKHDGTIIKNSVLTIKGRPPYSFAYCCDTSYNPAVVPIIKGADVLYHDATFGLDLSEKAAQRGHSTTKDAAMIAKAAEVRQLVIGHFSSRYRDPEILGDETRAFFPNTIVAREGLKIYFDQLGG